VSLHAGGIESVSAKNISTTVRHGTHYIADHSLNTNVVSRVSSICRPLLWRHPHWGWQLSTSCKQITSAIQFCALASSLFHLWNRLPGSL